MWLRGSRGDGGMLGTNVPERKRKVILPYRWLVSSIAW